MHFGLLRNHIRQINIMSAFCGYFLKSQPIHFRLTDISMAKYRKSVSVAWLVLSPSFNAPGKEEIFRFTSLYLYLSLSLSLSLSLYINMLM